MLYKMSDRKYTVNKDNLDNFLRQFEEQVYPVIKEGCVEKLEDIVEERRKQVEENKKRRDDVKTRDRLEVDKDGV